MYDAKIVLAIVLGMGLLGFTIYETRRGPSDIALDSALDRMQAVATKDGVTGLLIACNSTDEPIKCVLGGEQNDEISVTYYVDDGSHRKPQTTKRFKVVQRVMPIPE